MAVGYDGPWKGAWRRMLWLEGRCRCKCNCESQDEGEGEGEGEVGLELTIEVATSDSREVVYIDLFAAGQMARDRVEKTK